MEQTVTIDPTSEYSFRRALREARFNEGAINHAMRALFPEPDNELERLAETWLLPTDEPYEPTPDDLAELGRIFDQMDRDRGFEEAMARADIAEAIEDERRFTDQDLRAAGLPVG